MCISLNLDPAIRVPTCAVLLKPVVIESSLNSCADFCAICCVSHGYTSCISSCRAREANASFHTDWAAVTSPAPMRLWWPSEYDKETHGREELCVVCLRGFADAPSTFESQFHTSLSLRAQLFAQLIELKNKESTTTRFFSLSLKSLFRWLVQFFSIFIFHFSAQRQRHSRPRYTRWTKFFAQDISLKLSHIMFFPSSNFSPLSFALRAPHTRM